MYISSKSAIAIGALYAACPVCLADLVGEFDIGEGDSTSTVLFQFSNENQYLYTVHYDGALTGRNVFDLFEEAQPGFFDPIIESYDFGDFLVGLTIGDDFDEGFGTPPDYLDYWHYWTMEPDSTEWEASMIGFSDRVLSDGSADGWVFNSNDVPIPAPPLTFALIGIAAFRRRR